MENLPIILLSIALGLSWFTAFSWRQSAKMWKQQYDQLAAFINNPNVKARDKEAEYKNSYEAKLNALEDERRLQYDTLLEVFDFLNDNQPFGSHQEGLMQCRNKLMTTIQVSTYGRGNPENNDE